MTILMLPIACTRQVDSDSKTQTALMNSLEVPDRIRQLDSLAVYDPNQPPLHQINFTKEIEYEVIDPYLAPPAGTGPKTAVDQRGNLYLADQRQKIIRVYESEGNRIQTIGREGRGPGEFTFIATIAMHDGQLYVYDPQLTRIQPFSLDPIEVGRTINLDLQTFTGEDDYTYGLPRMEIFPFGENQFLVSASNGEDHGTRYTGYHIVDSAGRMISGRVLKLMQQERLEFTAPNGAAGSTNMPAGRVGTMDVTSDGLIYRVNTGELLIEIFDVETGYRRAIYYPFQNDPVETEELESLYSSAMMERIRGASLPDTWPAVADLFVDDEDRIWIATITNDHENYEWWVLEEDGTLFARFSWNREEELEIVRDGHLYVRVRDPETRAEHIERYEIKFTSHDD